MGYNLFKKVPLNEVYHYNLSCDFLEEKLNVRGNQEVFGPGITSFNLWQIHLRLFSANYFISFFYLFIYFCSHKGAILKLLKEILSSERKLRKI